MLSKHPVRTSQGVPDESPMMREVVRRRLFGRGHEAERDTSATDSRVFLLRDALQSQTAERERAEALWRLKRASAIGLCVWPPFALFDVVVQELGAFPLHWFWLWRFAAWVVGVAVLTATHFIPRMPRAGIRVLDFALFTTCGFVLGMMALRFEGVRSHYAHGVSLVMLLRAACMADPWQRGALHYGAIWLAFMGVLGATDAASFPAVGNWERTGFDEDWAAFTMQNFLLVGAAAVGTFGSDAAWRVQREVFANRDLGRYRIESLIGRGGMGEVWKARHTGLRRRVALKILGIQHRDSDPSVRRFEREVWAMSSLSHPNTVRILDHGVTPEGIRYYAMELLHGQDLRAHLQQHGPLDAARCRRLGLQAAASLAEAHRAGLIHRDIKPSNLFLATITGEADFLKVLDFGIAKVASEDATDLTKQGQLLGTPRYMAPEVALGAPADARSDVFSLGCVMYELLTGEPAIRGVSSMYSLLQQLEQVPPPPSELLGHPVPKKLEAVIMRCIAKDPEQRYADAGALRAALEEAEI